MVIEINDHYTKVQSQELTKAKEEVERLKLELREERDNFQTKLNELLKEVK